MFPTKLFSTSSMASQLTHQKEVLFQAQARGPRERYMRQGSSPAISHKAQPVLSQITLSIADFMIQSGQQLKKRHQPA